MACLKRRALKQRLGGPPGCFLCRITAQVRPQGLWVQVSGWSFGLGVQAFKVPGWNDYGKASGFDDSGGSRVLFRGFRV